MMQQTQFLKRISCLLALGLSLGAVALAGTPVKKADQNRPIEKWKDKGGAQLWGQNCAMRCHNGRSPTRYSDAQWDVITLHMRVRANLTGDEHRKIVAFLKSAN